MRLLGGSFFIKASIEWSGGAGGGGREMCLLNEIRKASSVIKLDSFPRLALWNVRGNCLLSRLGKPARSFCS